MIGAQLAPATPLAPYNLRPQGNVMPPLAPVARDYHTVGMAVNEEQFAKENLGRAQDAAFNTYYTSLKQNPQEMAKFVPSQVNTGINGMGAGVALTAQELESRQKAQVRQHFDRNIAPEHPDLVVPRQNAEDATNARIQGVPVAAIRNDRLQKALAEHPPTPQVPGVTKVTTGPKGTTTTTEYNKPPPVKKETPAPVQGNPPAPGTPGVVYHYNPDGTIKGISQSTPNTPATKPATPAKAPATAKPVPPSFDHNPTAAETQTWFKTVLQPWAEANKNFLQFGEAGSVKDPGPRPVPPWMKQEPKPNSGPYQGGAGIYAGVGAGGGAIPGAPATATQPFRAAPSSAIPTVAPDYTNNNATAASAQTQRLTPSSSIGTALPSPAAIPGSPTGVGAGVLANPAPLHTHTAINAKGDRIGYNPVTKQWEPL